MIFSYFRERDRHLPPGLEKREDLPPGLRKHLERDGQLPPGLEKRMVGFPPELDRQLPSLPPEYQRVIIGRDALVIEIRTHRIIDVFHGALVY
jgi:hypothetical protein